MTASWLRDPRHLCAAPASVEKIERTALHLTLIRAASLARRWQEAVADARVSDKRDLGNSLAHPVLTGMDAFAGAWHVPGAVGSSSAALLHLATDDGPVPVAIVLSADFESTEPNVNLRMDDTTMEVFGARGRLEPVATVRDQPYLVITQHVRFWFHETTSERLRLTSAKILALPSGILTEAYTPKGEDQPDFLMAGKSGKGGERIRINTEKLRHAASWRVVDVPFCATGVRA